MASHHHQHHLRTYTSLFGTSNLLGSSFTCSHYCHTRHTHTHTHPPSNRPLSRRFIGIATTSSIPPYACHSHWHSHLRICRLISQILLVPRLQSSLPKTCPFSALKCAVYSCIFHTFPLYEYVYVFCTYTQTYV